MAETPVSTTSAKQLHIEAIQTVTPGKATEPGQSRRVTTSLPLVGDLLKIRHRVVAYYKNATRGRNADYTMVAWFKESLNAVLGKVPLFAGRLRRNDEHGEGKVEVKFNDAGVRLVQAKAEMTMEEFMGMKGRDGREEALAFWEDVDERNPQFSALCYVQVTSFLGDGYSIAMTCSIFLADLVMLTDFFKTWARIHTNMLRGNSLSKTPIFHLATFKRPGLSSHLESFPLDSTPTGTASHTVLLEALGQDQAVGPFTAPCLREIIKATGSTSVSGLYLVGSGREEVTIESHVRKEDGAEKSGTKVVSWEVLGAQEAAFGEGNAPVHVSYHLQCGEGVVVVMIPSDGKRQGGLGFITATVPITVKN